VYKRQSSIRMEQSRTSKRYSRSISVPRAHSASHSAISAIWIRTALTTSRLGPMRIPRLARRTVLCGYFSSVRTARLDPINLSARPADPFRVYLTVREGLARPSQPSMTSTETGCLNWRLEPRVRMTAGEKRALSGFYSGFPRPRHFRHPPKRR